MNYILKYYKRSKYLGFEKIEYKEFNSYSELYNFVDKYKLRSCDYDIYGKVEERNNLSYLIGNMRVSILYQFK